MKPISEEHYKIKIDYMLKREWPIRVIEDAYVADLTKPAIVALDEWDVKVKNVIVLSGPIGVGKTVAAARWCMERTDRIRFSRATTFAASSRYSPEARDFYYNAPGLCLDDVGTEYTDKKESLLTDLDELIDTCSAGRRPLLITTNLRATEFRIRYGARVWDRLHQCANWKSLTGQSMRKP